MSLGRPPAYPKLHDSIFGMKPHEMRVWPLSGDIYSDSNKHKQAVAAYNYGHNFGYRIRTLTHEGKLYVIRVA